MDINKYNKELKNIKNFQVFCNEISSFIDTQQIIEKGNINKYNELQDTLRNDDFLSNIIDKRGDVDTLKLTDSIESLESLDSDKPIQAIPLLPIDLESLYRNDNKVNMVEYYNLMEKYKQLLKNKPSGYDTIFRESSLTYLYNKVRTLKQQLSNI